MFRPLLRTLACAAVALSGLTCRDSAPLTGPGIPQPAQLAVVPTFDVAPELPHPVLVTARATVFRLPGHSLVLDTTRAFPTDGSPLELSLPVTLQNIEDQFEVRLAAVDLAGDTAFRAVQQVVVKRNDPTPAPTEIPLVYAGPDTAIAVIAIAPRDTTFDAAAILPMRATVKRSDSTIFLGADIGWTSRSPALATIAADGRITAHGEFTNVWILAGTNNGKLDSTRVSARASVAAVVISPRPSSAIVNDTILLSAATLSSGGAALTGRPVTWTTPDGSVASVTSTGTASGRFIALAPGTARIIAAAETKADTITVSVSPAPVATVTLSIAPTDSLVLVRGSSGTIGAVLRDARGNVLTGRVITWSSSKPGSVSVDGSGTVTGLLADSVASVVASSEGKSAAAKVRVARKPVASVVTSVHTLSVPFAASTPVTAASFDAASAVNNDWPMLWTTEDATVATISPTSGRSVAINGNGLGTVRVIATSDTKADTIMVTVTPSAAGPVDHITVTPATSSIIAGNTVVLGATAFTSSGSTISVPITWSSSNTAIATVSSSGVVTGVDGGTVTISATGGGKTGTATVNVRSAIATIDAGSPRTITALTDTAMLSPVARDSHGAAISGVTFSYATSNPAVASVSTSGVVTAVANGTATITIAAEGTTTPLAITVAQTVTSIVVSPASAALHAIDDTLRFAATGSDRKGFTVSGATFTWSSSAPSVATIGPSSNRAMAVANGTTTITASNGPAFGTASLLVSQTTRSVTITPDTVRLASTGDTARVTGVARDANGYAIAGKTITYTTGDPAVATVSASGLVTLTGCGATRITASVDGFSAFTAVVRTLACVPIHAEFAKILIVPSSRTLQVGDGVTLSAYWVTADGASTPISPLWASKTPNRAAVTSAGVLMMRDTGSATIEATQSGVAGRAVFTGTPGTRLVRYDFASSVSGTSTAGKTVDVNVTATDAGTGIGTVFVVFTNPTGTVSRACTASAPTYGTATNGTWVCRVFIPAGSATGTWHMTTLSVNGAIASSFDEALLRASGFTATTLQVNP